VQSESVSERLHGRRRWTREFMVGVQDQGNCPSGELRGVCEAFFPVLHGARKLGGVQMGERAGSTRAVLAGRGHRAADDSSRSAMVRRMAWGTLAVVVGCSLVGFGSKYDKEGKRTVRQHIQMGMERSLAHREAWQ